MVLFRHRVTAAVPLPVRGAARRLGRFPSGGAITFLIPIIIISSFSCRKETPPEPPPGPTIELVTEDVGVTEAWLRVRFTDSATLRSFALTRDDSSVLSVADSPADTLVIDTALAPNRSYSYRAYRLSNSSRIDSTAVVQLTTLDTTSHNITWQIDTLGDGASSVLYDVAIINDTLAYSVGEIYLRDSIGQLDPDPYNVARWDGQRWNLVRVMFPICDPSGNEIGTAPFPARAVFAFAENNVWVTSGGTIAQWNGTAFSRICIRPDLVTGGINKVWATAPNDVYIVGYSGMILHFDGIDWQPIESGTTLDFYDIRGDWNPRTSSYEVYAVAAKLGVNFEKKIFRVFPTGVTELPDSGIPYSIHGIWFKPERRYFVVGDGMYSKRSIAAAGPWQWLHPGVTAYYVYGVRGTNLNDIFACGSFGETLHFNGATWRSFRASTAIAQGSYRSLDVQGSLVVAVGYEYPRAIVARGTR